jgi:hypothetical protein
MVAVALPAALTLQIGDVVGATMRTTNDTVSPADFNDRPVAVVVIREEQNRLLEDFGVAKTNGYSSIVTKIFVSFVLFEA